MRTIVAALLILFCHLQAVAASGCPGPQPVRGERYLVAISDLHFGVGRTGGNWHPTDDFRWERALAGFLERISSCGKQAVDLVIAGDALELWQPPKELSCSGKSPDTGCTPSEYQALAKLISDAHRNDLRAFGKFADRGSNRVFFVPGNHDAALLLDEVWKIVRDTTGSKSGRVFRCGPKSTSPCTESGEWVSEDGLVAIEHGHQIGRDVNKFSNWPDILTEQNGAMYVERPWGEWFVQSLFNAEEQTYPIIDNLTPEAAGARYRMADRGLWRSIADVAAFLRFNLFETSIHQKGQFLGKENADSGSWDLNAGRALGYKLFVGALPAGDPFREQLEGKTPQATALQNELTAMLNHPSRIPDEEVKQLCDQMAVNSGATCGGSFGYAIERAIVSRHDVLRSHLADRRKQKDFMSMELFIYGHTHELEEEWVVTIDSGNVVSVFNTGAFQRLIDEKGFLARAAAKNIASEKALQQFKNEDLPACYTAVVVALGSQPLARQTVRWHMEEDGPGSFISPGDPLCN